MIDISKGAIVLKKGAAKDTFLGYALLNPNKKGIVETRMSIILTG